VIKNWDKYAYGRYRKSGGSYLALDAMRTISGWPECSDVGACLSQRKIEEQGNEAGALMACSAHDLTARFRKDGVHTTRAIQ
jgi:hypothetical protein